MDVYGRPFSCLTNYLHNICNASKKFSLRNWISWARESSKFWPSTCDYVRLNENAYVIDNI